MAETERRTTQVVHGRRKSKEEEMNRTKRRTMKIKSRRSRGGST